MFLRAMCDVRLFGELHGNEAGDARFAHGDADEVVAGLHGAFAVGDDDELCLSRHFPQERAEAADVGVIKRGVHFVQEAERRGIEAEEGEDEREGGQCFFAAGEDAQVFDFFPRRAHGDGDAGFEDVAFGPGERGFAAPEQEREEAGEVAVDDFEGVLQAAARFVVQFGDGFFEQFEGVAQVAALFVQGAVFGFRAVVVGDGGEVDRAKRLHRLFMLADGGSERGFVRRVVFVDVERFAVVGEEFGGDALQLLLDAGEVFLVVVEAFFGKRPLVLAFAQGFLFAVQVVRLFFDGACGLGATLFVLLVVFFVGFVADVFFFEFEGEGFALFLQGGEGFFGVCAFGGEALRLFVAGGEVGAVLFERALGGAAVALDLLVLVVGLLVGVVRSAEGGFQRGHGR